MNQVQWDPEEFELQWTKLSQTVLDKVFADPQIVEIKGKVKTKGHVEQADRDVFITKVNDIKNKEIETQFGTYGSQEYQTFVEAWQHWLKLKGKDRVKPTNLAEENLDHILFGSTPDPDVFLRDFETFVDSHN